MKREFGKATVKYLGHIVGQGQVRPLDETFKPSEISFPHLTKRTRFLGMAGYYRNFCLNFSEITRFLGMAGYYRNFCLNFSEIAAPLTNLLSKKLKFVWTDDCHWLLTK